MKTITNSLALSLTLVATVAAQPGPGRGPMNVGAIIDARRALNLTPRQLVQLDSIERSHFAERSAMESRIRARFDSVCGKQDDCRLSDAQAAAMRDWRRSQISEVDMRRRDSVTQARVMSILDTTQRRMLTERRAPRERMAMRGGMGMGRGEAMGPQRRLRREMMMRRFGRMGPGYRGQMGQGFRGPMGRGPMGPAFRGQMGPGYRGQMGPGYRGQMGMGRRPMGPPPGFEDRRDDQREPPPPPRRGGRRPADSANTRPDSADVMERLP